MYFTRYVDGTGGCDGCLNWAGVGTKFRGDEAGKWLHPNVGSSSFGGNNGLERTVWVLEEIYTNASFPVVIINFFDDF